MTKKAILQILTSRYDYYTKRNVEIRTRDPNWHKNQLVGGLRRSYCEASLTAAAAVELGWLIGIIEGRYANNVC